MFHCTNAGHKPLNLPSSRVNDGLCDCCDASDEYSSNAQCINKCSELGKEDRLREKQRQELTKVGSQLKADLSFKGKALKTDYKTRLVELEKSRSEAEALKVEKEKFKKEAEELENAALDVYRQLEEDERRRKQEVEAEENKIEAEQNFQRYDSNENGLLEIAELQTRPVFDRDRNGEVSVEEAKYFLDEQTELDFETYLTVAWPRIKPQLMLDSGLFVPPKLNDDAEVIDNQDIDEGHDDVDVDHAAEEDEEHDEELNDSEDEEVGQGEIESTNSGVEHPEYDTETQSLIHQANDARNQFQVAEREFRELETEIKNLQDLLEKDYGPEEEYAPLNGECINYEDREYVYKLCPFDRAVQQPRAGGAETR